MTVLGRLPRRRDISRGDLEAAHLEGANLSYAHLEGAAVEFTHLNEAYLTGASLKQASLLGAYMEGAVLVQAHLEGANLRPQKGSPSNNSTRQSSIKEPSCPQDCGRRSVQPLLSRQASSHERA